ncbi:MAG: AI-2E family transporter [Chloroflexi bacterium]|nr:AI-2E family transporter [Chloroflexota bacterium]
MTEQTQRPIFLVVGLASIFIIMLGIKTTAAIINPILLALVITIAVSPLPQRLMKRGVSSRVAFVITIVAVVGGILAVMVLFGWSLYALRLKIPTYADNIAARSAEWNALFERTTSISVDLNQIGASEISGIALGVVGMFANALVQVFMTLLIFIFMLSAALTMSGQTELESGATTMVESFRVFTSDVSEYVNVTTVINLLVGIGDAIFLLIFGVDFALLWGLLAWFLGYIPTVGFWLALIPPTILAWAEHGPTTAFIVFIGFVLINGSVQNFIQPKMMGDNLNISPIVVFLSLFIWGWLLGAIGAILAVPLTLLILVTLEQFETTRGFVRLIRPKGSVDDEGARQAREEIGGFLDKIKATVGLGGATKPAKTSSGAVVPAPSITDET